MTFMKYISIAAYRLLTLVFMALIFNSCSNKMQFLQSTVVPAAEGKVKIKKDNNNNYSIDLNILNLAAPERLQSPKKSYVVWTETTQNAFKNLGQLKSSSGFLSNTLKASLNTVTTFQPKRIFITAEDDVNINYPYGQTILTTKDF